ncbi:hypothetical protein DAMA08_019020 [Martiniozyma asiatica (nom. inval.)]|nr:hypothetical protein DAMA08_019020 [Martiniozyma asiatica]
MICHQVIQPVSALALSTTSVTEASVHSLPILIRKDKETISTCSFSYTPSPSFKCAIISKRDSSYSRTFKKSSSSISLISGPDSNSNSSSNSNSNSNSNSLASTSACYCKLTALEASTLIEEILLPSPCSSNAGDEIHLGDNEDSKSYLSTSDSSTSSSRLFSNYSQNQSQYEITSLYSASKSCISVVQECLCDDHPLANKDKIEIELFPTENKRKDLLSTQGRLNLNDGAVTSAARFLKSAKSLLKFSEGTILPLPLATSSQFNTQIVLHDSIPLETFSVNKVAHENIDAEAANSNLYSNSPDPTRPMASSSLCNSRESRINSNFLRFYATDCANRFNNYLTIPECDLDFYQHEYHHSNCKSIDEFIENYLFDGLTNRGRGRINTFKNDLKIGLLAREKLWSNVILKPRVDLFNKFTKYEFIKLSNETNSSIDGPLVRNKGKFIPWINFDNFNKLSQKSLAPYGRLDNDTQFTVKGWAHTRWIDSSKD